MMGTANTKYSNFTIYHEGISIVGPIKFVISVNYRIYIFGYEDLGRKKVVS